MSSEPRETEAPAGDVDDASVALRAMLAHSARLPPWELRAYQESLLIKMVAHARASVPFYADRLPDIAAPGGGVDVARWLAIPLLTRADLQQNYAALESRNIPENHLPLHEGSTSGTSGMPVKYKSTALVSMVQTAEQDRFFGWNDFDGRNRLVHIKGDVLGPYPDGEHDPNPWLAPWLHDPQAAGRVYLRHPLPAASQLEFLSRQGACYLNTQPSNARMLATALLAGGLPKPDVRGVITLGEMVTDDLRRLVHQAFGCRVHDLYSATEVGGIAAECSHGNLHVNAESTFVEIIRPDGSLCEAGEAGAVVTAHLTNLAMPLIRYDTGDIGALSPTLCGCGVTLPVIHLTVGRSRNLFRFSDGTEVLGLVSPDRYREFFAVTQWQAAQIGPEEIEIRFASDADEADLDYGRVTEHLKEYFARPLSVRFTRLASLPVGRTGKLEGAVREFGA